jgi:MFS family permease
VSIAPYRDVLRLPGVARLLAFAVLARIPQTASGVVLTLYVVGRLGLGYAAAGVVATAATLGMAVGSPWRGRVVDRRGLRRAMVPSVVVSGLCWGVAPLLGFGPLIAVALLGGLLGVPIFGVVRQSLSVLVPADRRRTGFALDSIGTEISFMVGPAAGVLLATQLSTTVALVTVGVGSVLSGLGLMALNPPTRSSAHPPERGAAEPGAVQSALGPPGAVQSAAEPGADGIDAARPGDREPHWYTPGLLAVLGAALAAGLVLAGTDVGLVAQLRSAGALSLTGVVFLAWSGGSVIGGAVYGGMRRPVPPLLLLLVMAVLTVPVGLAPSPVLLALTILPAAALCAPLISSTAEAVSRMVPERARGEAMGWHGSALTVGSALGAPLSGAAIDAVSPWAGFAAVGTVGGVLGAVGLLLRALADRRSHVRTPPGGPGPGDLAGRQQLRPAAGGSGGRRR